MNASSNGDGLMVLPAPLALFFLRSFWDVCVLYLLSHRRIFSFSLNLTTFAQDGYCSIVTDSVRCTDRFAYNLYTFRSEEHTSELQSLMRISYAVFCLKK